MRRESPRLTIVAILIWVAMIVVTLAYVMG